MAASFLLLAAVRVWMLSHSEIIARDGIIYTEMAQRWASQPMHVIRDYEYHVGYPVAMVGMHGLLRGLGLPERPDTWDLAGGLVSLTASMVAMAGLWWWALKAYDRRVALVTVLLLGLGHKWAGLGADVLSDALAIAFQIWSLVLIHEMLQRLQGRRWSAVLLAGGAGLCGGLGYLVRPESLWIPALGVLAVLAIHVRHRLSWRMGLASVGSMWIAAAMICLPYMVAIGGLSKKKHLIDLVKELVISTTAAMPLASVQGSSSSEWFISRYISRVFEAIHPALGFLSLALVVAVVWRRLHRTAALDQAKMPSETSGGLMLLYVVPMASALLGLRRATGYLSHRHLMMSALVLSPLVGQALFTVAGLVRWLIWPKRWRPVPVSVFAAILAVPVAAVVLGHNLSKPMHYGKGVYRQAALDLARHTQPDTVIMADSRWVSHYVAQVDPQRPVVIEPDLRMPAEELRKQAGLGHASYVVLPAERPSLLEPRDAELTAAGFHLWKQYVAGDRDLLRVYLVPSAGGGS
ncbi:MAG: hypothetical protein MUP47_04625 [Phycisphaerae bacterium]|nr:hypothetical protein [Phycisphaerae bacterium]